MKWWDCPSSWRSRERDEKSSLIKWYVYIDYRDGEFVDQTKGGSRGEEKKEAEREEGEALELHEGLTTLLLFLCDPPWRILAHLSQAQQEPSHLQVLWVQIRREVQLPLLHQNPNLLPALLDLQNLHPKPHSAAHAFSQASQQQPSLRLEQVQLPRLQEGAVSRWGWSLAMWALQFLNLLSVHVSYWFALAAPWRRRMMPLLSLNIINFVWALLVSVAFVL